MNFINGIKKNLNDQMAICMSFKKTVLTISLFTCFFIRTNAQTQSIAVIKIDVQGMELNEGLMSNLVRLELEKKNVFSVMDKYDIEYILSNNDFNTDVCYGKICLIEAGKILKADKMLSGTIEKINDKIILIFRLIDVKTESIVKTDIMEYLDAPELQRMISISLNNLFDIPNDKYELDQIQSFNLPVNSPRTQLMLNGPRMGFAFIGGENGKIITSPLNEGGFDVFPLSTQLGYQLEHAYMSSGNFMALVEVLPMVSGLEQGRFVPSMVLMNGIRSSKSGYELAFGPIFEISKIEKGFYDYEGNWHLADEMAEGQNFELTKRLDSRADISTITTAWVWAFGKTFRSGHINIPVNIYFSMKKNGYLVGLSFGFNVSK